MANKFTVLTHLRAVAARAREFASDLVAQFAEATADVIEELDAEKADKSVSVAFDIPVTGWAVDETTEYPYYYDIAVTGVTALDRATVSIAPSSMSIAVSCELCPTNETLAGKIRIRAMSVPVDVISCEYWIEQGKEN